MSDAASELAHERATRDAAKEVMLARYEALRDELTPEQLKERVTERLTGDARRAAIEAKAVVAENRTVVVGTLALALGWLLRRPLTWLGETTWRKLNGLRAGPRSPWGRLRVWINKENSR